MSEISLPDKYRFHESMLAYYKPGSLFPQLTFKDGKDIVSDPKNPLSKFMQFYIDNVIDFSGDKDSVYVEIIEPAHYEREFLNKRLGVPQLTLDETEEGKYVGAIDRLKTYTREIERAISCAVSKGVPPAEWPLEPLIKRKEDLDKRIKRIMDAEGKQNFVVFRIHG